MASATTTATATATASALDMLIQHLAKTPYSHEYDNDNKYYRCCVLRTSGAFCIGLVCEHSLYLASTGDRSVHVNVWPVGYEATASSPWPPATKMVPFQDFLKWNTP